MTSAEVQIHGYRKGHQLIASSTVLPKSDQAILDRLSDVAGPLRPTEQFAPYLTAYPLPSGTHYVVARTWQDMTVPRAGCVRTKSLLLDSIAWSYKPLLAAILSQLSSTELPSEKDAVVIELDEKFEEHFPPTPSFGASELLEALFLEDAKPVVVFDAPDPELIASRILTALWPEIRRRFTLSTFALSPRKIGGRDFDLVFAPSNAKSKFSDWPGRRVDGQSNQIERHRWTGAIVRRVFEEPVPRLLSGRDVELLGDRDADTAAALRIVMLWDELLDKLDRTPAAALGLFDIANSGMVNSAVAMKSLEPRLVRATRSAADSLSRRDAWDFVGAIARKIQGHDMPAGKIAVAQLAEKLAKYAPDGAIGLLRQSDRTGAIDDLIHSIATGLGNGAAPFVEQVLVEAPIDIISRLVSQGGMLVRRVANDDELIKRMAVVLTQVDRKLAGTAGEKLLPHLTQDRQLPAAIPVFANLDSQDISAALCRLRDINDFQAEQLGAELVNRAREVDGLLSVREVLASSDASVRRDSLLEQTLDPVAEDVEWLLNEKRLPEMTSGRLLANVLRRADDNQFAALLSDVVVSNGVVTHLSDNAIDVLERAVAQDKTPINAYVRIIQSVIRKVDNKRKFEIAEQVVGRCLQNRFDEDEAELFSMLFSTLGERLDGRSVVSMGLERGVDADIASRNLVFFGDAPLVARKNIVRAVEDIARALHERYEFDLTEAAYDACAKLMFDAEITSRKALIDAAGQLMPSLLRARNQPVSPMIATLFPVIYRELAKADDVPDLLKFVPFFDWDRCKTARHELVYAFISSSWSPGDLALTAHRSGDVIKILERVAKVYGGKEYLTSVEHDLGRLDFDDRKVVKRAINQIRLDFSSGYDR